MTDTATETEKKRGTGPYKMSFLDGEKNETARCPVNPHTVRLALKESGKHVDIDVHKISEKLVRPLAVYGLAKRLDGKLRATKGTDGSVPEAALQNVISEFVSEIEAGTLFDRAEGAGAGKRGRPFNVDMWVEVAREIKKVKGENFADNEVAAFASKMTEDVEWRKAMIAKWNTNPKIKAIISRVKAKLDQKAAKEAEDSDEGFDF